MAKHQLQSFLAFEDNDWKDNLPPEVNYLIEGLYLMFKSFIWFDPDSPIDFTEEDSLLDEEVKQDFLNEYGLDEDTLKYIFKQNLEFFARVKNSSTEEEFQSVWEERNLFLQDNDNFMKALKKHVQEKTQKSTSPAA